MRFVDLHWLPSQEGWRKDFSNVIRCGPASWSQLVRLGNARLDFLQTNSLDKVILKNFKSKPPSDLLTKPVKLAVLSSSTTDHLLSGIRVAALRRNMWLQIHSGNYGQYIQELMSTNSEIYAYEPNVVLFSFDARHLLGRLDTKLCQAGANTLIDQMLNEIRPLWRIARERFGAQVIQQTLVPIFSSLAGNNEHRLAASPLTLLNQLNERFRREADTEGVDILSIDHQVGRDGLHAWHDPMLWYRAKQEVSPAAGPAYGELCVRIVAAQQGLSSKCLVLDLDNTLWGGVIGDDGLEGIRLGQGSALGESYVAFQNFVRDLSKRGVILAVCSKNDQTNALAPFTSHPDMVLKRDDISCFIANWNDKPSNLREIARRLNIGLDSLVFLDDNPFERNIVRAELPMVAVPEVADEPALYSQAIADGGYFEALQITKNDLDRSEQYRTNILRENMRESHTDLAGYLRSLNMEMYWSPFDNVGLQRIIQLINKTNQFNLTVRRYTEQEVLRIIENPNVITLQIRLVDKFGDNGIIGVVIGELIREEVRITTWLMSCRVLGRQVEEETLNVLAREAQRMGASALVGEYLPTKKNGMVKDLYSRLGFRILDESNEQRSAWHLSLTEYELLPTFISSSKV